MPSSCPRCGAAAAEGARFCESCGQPLDQEAGSASSPSPPPASPPERPGSASQKGAPRRLGAGGVAMTVTGSLAVAVVAGLVVPKILKHPEPIPIPPVPSTSTTLPPAPTTTTLPPSPPTSTTTTPTTTTTSTTTTTTIPVGGGGNGGGSGGGESASNSVASVRVPAGWTVDPTSTSTSLFLDGPDGLYLQFWTQQQSGSTTLAAVFQSELANRQQHSPDARVCEQPQQASVPNGPSGEAIVICFTLTPENGPAVPYSDLDYAALVPVGDLQLLVEADAFIPGDLSASAATKLIAPLWSSVRWRQLPGG